MLKQQPSTNFCHWLKQPKKFQTTDTHPDVQFAFQQSMGDAGKAGVQHADFSSYNMYSP